MMNALSERTRRAVRCERLAVVLFLALPALLMVPMETADASTSTARHGVDQSSWVTTKVPHAHFSVELSTAWTELPQPVSDATKALKPPGATTLLSRMNAQTGDSFVVLRYRGDGYAYWFKNLDEFRANAAAGAKLTKAKLVSATTTSVGTQPAYLQLQTFVDAHQPVIWGELDIREKKRSVISIVLELTSDQPAARATVQAIFDDVKPA